MLLIIISYKFDKRVTIKMGMMPSKCVGTFFTGLKHSVIGTMHTGRGAVSYQSEIPYIWLKNAGAP